MKVELKYTAAPEYLLKTIDNFYTLDDTRNEEFHTITAEILWSNQRTRPYVQLLVDFCYTRVQASIYHDWKKLTHLTNYSWATRLISPIITSDGKDTIIYIDSAHIVHSNCKEHSGLFVTQRKGAMINVSKTLGLMNNSSTETEIVATGVRLPKCTWFCCFRIEQGEPVKGDVLIQDNKSCMSLQKNGQFSVGKGSKHIHIRYFIADFSTKSLHGATFVEFCNKIQGIQVEDFLINTKGNT